LDPLNQNHRLVSSSTEVKANRASTSTSRHGHLISQWFDDSDTASSAQSLREIVPVINIADDHDNILKSSIGNLSITGGVLQREDEGKTGTFTSIIPPGGRAQSTSPPISTFLDLK
jgi:hypothetical protein